jgi:hypothetical protein
LEGRVGCGPVGAVRHGFGDRECRGEDVLVELDRYVDRASDIPRVGDVVDEVERDAGQRGQRDAATNLRQPEVALREIVCREGADSGVGSCRVPE